VDASSAHADSIVPEWIAVVGVLLLAFLALRHVIWHGGRRGVSAADFLLGWLPHTAPARWLARGRDRLARAFPRATGFVGQRLSTQRFTGLPLTLIAVAGLYLLALLTEVAQEVVQAEDVRVVDGAVNAFLDRFRSAQLVSVFVWITELGSTYTLTAASIIATGFLWAYGRTLFIPPLWLCILGSQATTWAGKYLFDRARPEFVAGVEAASPSFPSAHATGAFAVYAFIAYALLRDLDNHKRRFDIGYWTTVLIALIAFSRVFLSVHFASDVAAGLLVGLFWLLCGVAYCEMLRARRRADGDG
jgi:undecaprenyl-diphosphatase